MGDLIEEEGQQQGINDKEHTQGGKGFCRGEGGGYGVFRSQDAVHNPWLAPQFRYGPARLVGYLRAQYGENEAPEQPALLEEPALFPSPTGPPETGPPGRSQSGS